MPGEGHPLKHKHMYSVKYHPEQADQGASPPVGLGPGGPGLWPSVTRERVKVTLEHVLVQPDGKDRCLVSVQELSRAFALAVPSPEALGPSTGPC